MERRRERHERYSLAGPIILVTLGILFLIGQFVPAWGVTKTWPVLLIVFGLTKLLESARAKGATRPN